MIPFLVCPVCEPVPQGNGGELESQCVMYGVDVRHDGDNLMAWNGHYEYYGCGWEGATEDPVWAFDVVIFYLEHRCHGLPERFVHDGANEDKDRPHCHADDARHDVREILLTLADFYLRILDRVFSGFQTGGLTRVL